VKRLYIYEIIKENILIKKRNNFNRKFYIFAQLIIVFYLKKNGIYYFIYLLLQYSLIINNIKHSLSYFLLSIVRRKKSDQPGIDDKNY